MTPTAPRVRDTSVTLRANKKLHTQFARLVLGKPGQSQADIFEKAMQAFINRNTKKES